MKIKELFETDELTWGYCIGGGFYPIIGWWALLLGICTAVLTRLGGIGLWQTKAWRRIGVPLLILLSLSHQWTLFFIVPMALSVFILSLGYGTRSPNDEGSPFGNFCLKIGLKLGGILNAEYIAHIMTRSIIVVGIWASWYITLWLQ